MESPPKRMTRARAAAKATEPAPAKPTRTTKASAAPAAGPKRTASKRKSRADESGDEHQSDAEDELSAKTRRPARGRPAKAANNDPAPSTTKGGRTKTTAKKTEMPTTDASKPTRGRPRKVAEEPTRATAAPSRATASTTSSRAAAKPGPKKTVHFEEPDKENVDMAPPKTVAAGIRGRPSRRGGAVAAVAPRSAAKKATETKDKKKPLSPKKVTQMPFSSRDRDSSEDELAADELDCMKPLKKAAIKPPVKKNEAAKKPAENIDETGCTQEVNAAIRHSDDTPAFIVSPARRPPSTPFKETLQSPAKKMPNFVLPGPAMKTQVSSQDTAAQASPQRNTLLQSAAKRPASPIKGFFASPSKPTEQGPQSAMKRSLLQSPAKRGAPSFQAPNRAQQQISPAIRTITPATPGSVRPSQKLMDVEELDSPGIYGDDDEGDEKESATPFHGRLSAALPRHADPILEEEGQAEAHSQEDPSEGRAETEPNVEQEVEIRVEEAVVEGNGTIEDAQGAIQEVDYSTMDIDEPELEETCADASAAPSAGINKAIYRLREKDLDPCNGIDTDSEDELTLAADDISLSPAKGERRIATFQSRRSTLGFTDLVAQLGEWSAGSPAKGSRADMETGTNDIVSAESVGDGPDVGSAFFEEEMVVRPDAIESPKEESVHSKSEEADVDEDAFGDVMVTDEDVALQAEAKEMAENQAKADPEHHSFTSDNLSEASQEYGDENEVPIDPALSAPVPTPVTPIRAPIQRTFHTTTKVPLKPEHTPSPMKQRSFSASRAAPKRPFVPTRNATVISYSPEKPKTPEAPHAGSIGDEEWSVAGSPARTPRKDLDPDLLRGAVVFVDVHTSEGADASGIFVELLTSMGARCVKSWNWSPSGGDGSKVGITHVVYKDGGKRTMEKVRQTNGVVHCVGVSWVLDCERENQWLSETLYYIDTSLIPRGGARRRKSMEPKALANDNGTLITGTGKASSRNSLAPPVTPIGRRQSTLWVRTPSDQGDNEEDDDDDDDIEWSKFILTPAPKTPAPEAVARYAAGLYNGESDEDNTIAQPMTFEEKREQMLMRTCPPKASMFVDLGKGILSQEQDEGVKQRLMAARRKSLQHAPKIGSPLSKTWK